MPYIMEFYVDGACRGNGRPGSTGAAAACLMKPRGGYNSWTELLPLYEEGYVCTNQRAELHAIIMALEGALDKDKDLFTRPYLIINIHSDSRYAITCMSDWIHQWRRSGWSTVNGDPVKNQDLIRKAGHLEDQLAKLGELNYIWVPREKNYLPDRHCNEALDAAAVVPVVPYYQMMNDILSAQLSNLTI